MRFLYYGHVVLQGDFVIVKYKAIRIDTSVTHTYRGHVVKVVSSSSRSIIVEVTRVFIKCNATSHLNNCENGSIKCIQQSESI